MRPEDLIDAIGEIDGKLLKETDELRRSKKTPKKRWRASWKWAGVLVAACFCVVVCFNLTHMRMGTSMTATEDSAEKSSDNYMAGSAGSAESDEIYEESEAESEGSEEGAGAGKLLCSLSDYDAEIYVYDNVETLDEMTFKEALEIITEEGCEWYIVCGEQADENLIDEMVKYAEENAFDDALLNLIK